MATTSISDLTTGKKPDSPVAAFGKFMEKLKPQMAVALPRHMNADRMTRLALTAFSTTPALQQCTLQSIAASVMTAAQLGLEPGVNGQGYLIPYKNTCTFVPGWKGLVDMVARAGRATVWTGAVFEGDDFDYQLGDAPFVRHRPNPDGNESKLIYVYAIGRVRDAQMPVIEVWSVGKVRKHLNQFNKVGQRHYANASASNFEMYARKVALLQVLKYMPSSVELAAAMTVTHAAEAGQGVVLDGNFVTTVTDPATGEITPTGGADGAMDAGGAETMTFAQVSDHIQKADTPAALDMARGFIGAVPDPVHQAELTAEADKRAAALAHSPA